MRIKYMYDKNLLEIKEVANGNDMEFLIILFETELKKKLVKVRQYFDENKVLTDIHFYIHSNNNFQVIVRNDFYNEFILQLFRQQLLQEIKWN